MDNTAVIGTDGIQGINIITYYAATVFQNSIGLSPFLSRLLAACNGTEYFLASFIAIFTIEKFGRRKLMLFGATGQAVSIQLVCYHSLSADVLTTYRLRCSS